MTVSHRFKLFEVRPNGRLLLVDGKAAEIGSRAFDLLLMLIEHRDRVVTKQELLAHLWPRMVVEENNLHIHVSALRKLIGAAAIVTVQGTSLMRLQIPPSVPCTTGLWLPAAWSVWVGVRSQKFSFILRTETTSPPVMSLIFASASSACSGTSAQMARRLP